jgi:hypothetical protein
MTNLMNRFCKNVFARILAPMLYIGSAHADVYAVITSDHSVDSTKVLGRVVGKLALTRLQRKDTLVVFDGTSRKLISTVTIPDKSRFQEGKFRLRYVKKRFASIAKLIRKGRRKPSANADNNLIGLFREFGDNVRSSFPGEAMHVLMFGSALHADAREPKFSMRNAAYPNDGHFNVDGFASPYGVTDRAQVYRGTVFHFCNANDRFVSSSHRDLVHRVWSLYITKQGGVLATFSSDSGLCIGRFLSSSKPARTFTANPNPKPPAMIQLEQKQVETAAPIAPAVEEATTEQPQQRLEFTQAGRFLGGDIPVNERSALNTVGRIKVGVRWDCTCDLDLYVRLKDMKKPLYFANLKSAKGRFFKDWRSSPDNEKAHEYVEFFKPVDALDLSLTVNFYSGKAPRGVNGTVRIWLEGQDGVWELPFHIPAHQGNSGKHKSNSKHWVTIKPSAVLGLVEGRRAQL